ncbi:purine-nucleoside phosphorylase, partial [Balneolaceae bacterium ANBcel3]|nr:purine-nucleoside phosphorylase [Balneolaceae bacterium ANBcel3]
EHTVAIPYEDIPGFPNTAVAGHDGVLYAGILKKKVVLAWSGRFHLYEGHALETTLLPVRLSHSLGCRALIVTNAAGGINPRYRVGDIMLIDDLITFMGKVSPFRKKILARYHPDRRASDIHRLAAERGIAVTRGTYLFTYGPTYETKAEVRAFRVMGADAVGMSTAAELAEASRLDMNTLGISLITNQATGISEEKLDHEDIKKAASLSEKKFISLISTIITHPQSPIYSS